jgi:hypothetical protein
VFKKIAAEALGISDVGVIIAPADYHKVHADDYLFHEDGEKIFFLIKSKKDKINAAGTEEATSGSTTRCSRI